MAATDLRGGRLFAGLCAAVALLVAGAAHAQSRGSARLGVYQDDNQTLVITPMVAASAQPVEGASVSASYLADMVTSSSVDVVSAATKRFAERRDDLSFAAGYTTSRFLTVGAVYDYSHERDYASHTVGVQVAKEVFDRTLTLGLGWNTSLNTVGRSGDPNFDAAMTNHALQISAGQVINKDTLVKLTYHGQRADGFQASVYRYVYLESAADGGLLRRPEVVPDLRWRHAAAAAVNHHLGGDWFVQGSYRLYRDTWGITGHTAGARLIWTLTDALHLRLRQRLHYQGAASFYASTYPALQTYMTSDKELGELISSTSGVKIDYEWRAAAGSGWGIETFGVELKADYLRFEYADFARLSGLSAITGEIGTSVTF